MVTLLVHINGMGKYCENIANKIKTSLSTGKKIQKNMENTKEIRDFTKKGMVQCNWALAQIQVTICSQLGQHLTSRCQVCN